jgi:hypothetical protein
MPVILILGRLRQEVLRFEASLGCIARPSLKKPKDNSNLKRSLFEALVKGMGFAVR